MSVSIDPDKPNYIGLINESVHTADDVDIGDIYAINKYFLVVKRGFINIHFYYIPIEKVEGWDGYVLWLKISEEEVVKKYERDVFPNPLRYYVKNFPYQGIPPPAPAATIIPPRVKDLAYVLDVNDQETVKTFTCDLCNTVFDNEEEYNRHIKNTHL